MNIRDRVKRILNMCGHALTITIHDRLDRIEARLSELRAQNIELAENHNAILQSAIQMVEGLQGSQTSIVGQREEFKLVKGSVDELHADIGKIRDEAPSALAKLVKGSVDELHADIRKLLEQDPNSRHVYDAIVNLQHYTQAVFDEELVRQVCVETSDYEFTNPEIGLMAFLYSHLPTRKAIDVGAHVGDVTAALLKTGYEVFSFEPYAPVYQKLVNRLGNFEQFHPFNHALGSIDAEMPLHLAKPLANTDQWGDATVFNSLTTHSMPSDLPFSGTVTVTVKDLAGLHKSKVIPEDISLVKIDTEGFDLEVVRGMGEHSYPVVAVEFWDSDIPFGKSGLLYTAQSMVEEMGRRGYHWYIVLYRVWGRNQTAFYCNHARPVPQTWGNMIFFRDYNLFSQGQAWCSAVLPRTYFKPVPSA